MSTSAASGAIPPAQAPQTGAIGGASSFTETHTIVPTTTTQTDRVSEVATQALAPPSTSHETKVGKTPHCNLSGKVESQSSADQKTDAVAQKVGIEHAAEKPSEDEVAFAKQRDSKTEIKEGWLDLSDDESFGLAELFEGETIPSGKESHALSHTVASTLVHSPEHVSCFKLTADGAQPVDNHTDSPFIIDHKNKIIVCKDPDAMGHRSGGQVKACAQDMCKAEGRSDDLSGYTLHVTDKWSKEGFVLHLNSAITFITTVKEKIQELKHYPNPSIQANHVSPNMAEVLAAKQKATADDTFQVGQGQTIATKKATSAESIKQMEDSSREREREILDDKKEIQKEALRKELFQKSYENKTP